MSHSNDGASAGPSQKRNDLDNGCITKAIMITARYQLVSLIVLMGCLSTATSLARSEPGYGDHPLDQVSLEQRLGEHIPLDVSFVNSDGQTVPLRDVMSGHPTVLVLAYYRCPMLCGLVLHGLVDALNDSQLEAGRDYEVAVVSIDPRETSTAASHAKLETLQRCHKPETGNAWHFLTGRPQAIRALADAVGYHYAYDKQTNQYAHPSGIVIIAPDGKLSRYFYGFRFDAAPLTSALREASAGHTGAPATEVLLRCFLYDPATGRYGMTIIGALRIGGVLTVLTMVIVIWRWLRRDRRSRCEQASSNATTDQGSDP